MATLTSQPQPVQGAARYWANGKDIMMRCCDGYVSCIATAKTEGTALDSAKAWQEKENKVVTNEAKRLALA